jgi:hypothetical protein
MGYAADVQDDQISGTEEVRFRALQDGVAVGLALDYTLKRRNPLRALADLLFIRRAWRESLQRTLARFAAELEAEAEAPMY